MAGLFQEANRPWNRKQSTRAGYKFIGRAKGHLLQIIPWGTSSVTVPKPENPPPFLSNASVFVYQTMEEAQHWVHGDTVAIRKLRQKQGEFFNKKPIPKICLPPLPLIEPCLHWRGL